MSMLEVLTNAPFGYTWSHKMTRPTRTRNMNRWVSCFLNWTVLQVVTTREWQNYNGHHSRGRRKDFKKGPWSRNFLIGTELTVFPACVCTLSPWCSTFQWRSLRAVCPNQKKKNYTKMERNSINIRVRNDINHRRHNTISDWVRLFAFWNAVIPVKMLRVFLIAKKYRFFFIISVSQSHLIKLKINVP